MTGFNLPPGIEVTDLPGNRPEDEQYERLANALYEAIGDGWNEDEVIALFREEAEMYRKQNASHIDTPEHISEAGEQTRGISHLDAFDSDDGA